jgi:hypothetical protein
MIEYVGFDFDSQALKFFRHDFALPASLNQASLDFRAAEILTSAVPLSDLQEAFHSFVGGETPTAMIAVASPPNSATIFDEPRVPDRVVIFSTEWASHRARGHQS